MAGQRIEDKRPGARQHGLLFAEREDGADTASFTALSRDLDRELDQRLENFGVILCNLTKDAFKHGSTHSTKRARLM